MEREEILARTGGREIRRIVFDSDQIARRVAEIGKEIAAYYPADEELLLVGLLKGSFIFVGDLVREVPRPVKVDFLVASSYGGDTTSSGRVELLYNPRADLEDRHVVLVEDIVDSGTTINRLVPMLRERRPKSIEMCALLHKNLASEVTLEPRWVGFDAPNEFLIGYGLDHAENYRHLPFIASL